MIKKATWNLLHAYIDANSQILIDEYPGDILQAKSKLKYQCASIIFVEQIRYNRLFQQVIHKVRESAINYIKIFKCTKAFLISVINSYSGDHLMHTFLYNFHQGGNYSTLIAMHQAELSRKEFLLIKIIIYI